jgi:putative membrane protein
MVQVEDRPADTSAGASRMTPADPDNVSVELSARRTGMSFQRTRLSAERTLMSVIRTSLSLIGFGFTIFQFFAHLRETNVLTSGGQPARNFGATLVLLGVAMLVVGIWYHLAFMRGLRMEREQMKLEHLIHAESAYPVSMTLIVAGLLLVVGLFAILSMIFRTGPFG